MWASLVDQRAAPAYSAGPRFDPQVCKKILCRGEWLPSHFLPIGNHTDVAVSYGLQPWGHKESGLMTTTTVYQTKTVGCSTSF